MSFADVLRPYRGRYVAVRANEVIFDAETPTEVLQHLRDQGITADSMFRVPLDPEEGR